MQSVIILALAQNSFIEIRPDSRKLITKALQGIKGAIVIRILGVYSDEWFNFVGGSVEFVKSKLGHFNPRSKRQHYLTSRYR